MINIGFGAFDPIFKVIYGYFLKMMLSLEPVQLGKAHIL